MRYQVYSLEESAKKPGCFAVRRVDNVLTIAIIPSNEQEKSVMAGASIKREAALQEALNWLHQAGLEIISVTPTKADRFLITTKSG